MILTLALQEPPSLTASSKVSENELSFHDRGYNVGFRNARWIQFEKIVLQDDQVGVFAHFDGAGVCIEEVRKGSINGVSGNGLIQRDAVNRVEYRRWIAFGVDASDSGLDAPAGGRRCRQTSRCQKRCVRRCGRYG